MFLICLICSVSDAILITIGTTGIGKIVEKHPNWLTGISWFGASYLFVFGLMSFKAALGKQTLQTGAARSSNNRKLIVSTVLALTFLNPHVYLDTVLLIGSIASPYDGVERFYFTLGAIMASFIWFFSLGYGARLLEPIFTRPIAWKILNMLIGFVMWWIAYQLVNE